jgi:hypothetical protein
MADKELLRTYGELAATKGFVDYGSNISPGRALDVAARKASNAAAERESKYAAVKSGINANMAKMDDNVDLTAYTSEEQKGIRNFITAERSRYAFAANEISKISDTTSPEYRHYADIMNEVNNGFKNLKTQLDGYKSDKVEFVKGVESDLWSAGNENFDMAASIYGVNEPTTFVIGDGGNIGFGVGNEVVAYSDFDKPFAKDFKTVNKILDKTNTLFSNHRELNVHSERALRAELTTMLNNPKALQSLLSSDFNDIGISFPEGLVNDPANIDAIRSQVMDTLMASYKDVAAQGKAEYDASRNPANPSNANSGYSSTQQSYLSKITVIGKNPQTTITIPNQSGRFKFHEPTGSFIKVNSDGQFDNQGNGNFTKITLDDFAGLTGVKVEDIQAALGIN